MPRPSELHSGAVPGGAVPGGAVPGGAFDTTLGYAIDIWSDFGKVQVEGLTSADVLDRSFIN